MHIHLYFPQGEDSGPAHTQTAYPQEMERGRVSVPGRVMDEGMSEGGAGQQFQISDAHSPAIVPQQNPPNNRKAAFDM